MGLAARVGPEESGGPQTVSLGDTLAPEDKVAVARAVVWDSGFPALVHACQPGRTHSFPGDAWGS